MSHLLKALQQLEPQWPAQPSPALQPAAKQVPLPAGNVSQPQAIITPEPVAEAPAAEREPVDSPVEEPRSSIEALEALLAEHREEATLAPPPVEPNAAEQLAAEQLAAEQLAAEQLAAEQLAAEAIFAVADDAPATLLYREPEELDEGPAFELRRVASNPRLTTALQPLCEAIASNALGGRHALHAFVALADDRLAWLLQLGAMLNNAGLDKLLVVDADLAAGALTAQLGARQQAGLAEILTARTAWKSVVHTGVAFDFIARGRATMPASQAESSRIEVLAHAWKRQYSATLVAAGNWSCPIGGELARCSDHAYLVLTTGRTELPEVQLAANALRRAGALLVGSILLDDSARAR